MAVRYRTGGFGYGEVKKAIASLAESFFAPARQRRRELEKDPAYVLDVLGDGAKRAQKKAREVLNRAKSACGVGLSP
jgi:tryptophanyl-tRNA synthetase